MRPSLRRPTAVTLLLVTLAAQPSATQTQKKAQGAGAPPACEAGRALQLVRQQLSEAGAVEHGGQRVAVMARAADLLWPYDEAQARAAFADAFELASAHYREHGQESSERKPTRPGSTLKGLTYALPDPRVTVIRALTRRDPAWAQKLAARAAEETRQRAADAEAKARREGGAAERLLSMARSLLADDMALALSVARQSLHQPPTHHLSSFIYDVAKSDRAAADALYADALRAYSGADASALLLLSAYPFGFNMNIGLPSGYNSAGFPPPGFAPSPELQRQFVAAFLRLSERRLGELAGEPPQDDPSKPSEVELIYTTLTALEAQYGPADKTHVGLAAPLKQRAGAMLTERGLKRAESGAFRKLNYVPEADTSGVLDRVMRGVEGIKDPEVHDRQIVMGLQGAFRTESVGRLEAAAGKIKDEIVRRQFLDWLYFTKSLEEIRGGRLDEAARLAEKIESLEDRAALAGEVAAAELKLSDDPHEATRAASLAESVYSSAQRAPESEEKVRALLNLAYIYTRLDPLRAPALLSEAVAATNRLPGLDLTRPFLPRAIEGKTYSFYGPRPAPGFSLENVLRELAPRDFEAALAASGALDDKYLRAISTVWLASKCLEDAPKPEKPAAPAKAAPKQPPPAKRPAETPKPQAPAKRRP